MWKASGTTIEMAEGDYGISLPIKINGITFGESDSVKFRVTDGRTRQELLELDFDHITQNTVEIVLTEAQSEALPAGEHSYTLDWYRDGVFMCNIIPFGVFRVVKKA